MDDRVQITTKIILQNLKIQTEPCLFETKSEVLILTKSKHKYWKHKLNQSLVVRGT